MQADEPQVASELEGAGELGHALAERDEKAAQMEAQTVGAFKSTVAAEVLARQIGEMGIATCPRLSGR